MKTITVFCTWLIYAAGFSAEFTLEQLQELVLKNNNRIKATSLDIEAAEVDVKIQRAKFLPKLGVQLGKEWTRSTSLNESDDIRAIYGNVNLFNGFKDSSGLKKSRLTKSFYKKNSDSKRLEFKLNIEELFYNYLFLRKKEGILKSALSRNNKHLKLVKRRLNSSLITKTDLLEFQLRKSELEAEYESIILSLNRFKKRIFSYSGVENIQESEIIGELPHLYANEKLESVLSKGIKNNNDIRNLELSTKLNELDSKINNSAWYPSVNLQARHGHLDENETGVSNDERATVVSVMATWELFSGMSTKEKMKKIKVQKVANQYRLKQTKLDLGLEIENLLNKLSILEKRINSTEEQQKVSKKLYKETLAEYKKGVKDSGSLTGASDLLKGLSSQIYEMKLE